jgi:hypothetical protein
MPRLRPNRGTELELREATFLFGKTADIVEEQEEDSDIEDDEAASEGDYKSDSEDADKENEVQTVSVQPSLPEDTFGAALSLSSGKRKRKAAWVDSGQGGQ